MRIDLSTAFPAYQPVPVDWSEVAGVYKNAFFLRRSFFLVPLPNTQLDASHRCVLLGDHNRRSRKTLVSPPHCIYNTLPTWRRQRCTTPVDSHWVSIKGPAWQELSVCLPIFLALPTKMLHFYEGARGGLSVFLRFYALYLLDLVWENFRYLLNHPLGQSYRSSRPNPTKGHKTFLVIRGKRRKLSYN